LILPAAPQGGPTDTAAKAILRHFRFPGKKFSFRSGGRAKGGMAFPFVVAHIFAARMKTFVFKNGCSAAGMCRAAN
jgi:hypothetical protein